MIWCTNDPNVHSFCERWSFIWRWFLPLSIFNYSKQFFDSFRLYLLLSVLIILQGNQIFVKQVIHIWYHSIIKPLGTLLTHYIHFFKKTCKKPLQLSWLRKPKIRLKVLQQPYQKIKIPMILYIIRPSFC